MNDKTGRGGHCTKRDAVHLRKARGFTLIELMIVVAIVAILAGIAYASYDYAMIKSRRNAAAGCVLEKAQFMERFYTTNLRYNEDIAGNDVVLPAGECDNELQGHYGFALDNVSATAYTITATPEGHQLAEDTECGALSIIQTGQKSVTGTDSVEDCW